MPVQEAVGVVMAERALIRAQVRSLLLLRGSVDPASIFCSGAYQCVQALFLPPLRAARTGARGAERADKRERDGSHNQAVSRVGLIADVVCCTTILCRRCFLAQPNY